MVKLALVMSISLLTCKLTLYNRYAVNRHYYVLLETILQIFQELDGRCAFQSISDLSLKGLPCSFNSVLPEDF